MKAKIIRRAKRFSVTTPWFGRPYVNVIRPAQPPIFQRQILDVQSSSSSSSSNPQDNDNPEHNILENSADELQQTDTEETGNSDFNNASSESNGFDSNSNDSNCYFREDYTGNYNRPFEVNSSLQLFDVLFMVLNYYVRHMPTQQAIEDLLQMMNIIAGYKAFPQSFAGFMAVFPDTYDMQKVYFCKNCLYRYGKTEPDTSICPVPNCNSKAIDFLTIFPLKRQIREIVTRYKNEINNYSEELQNSNIRDVKNGQIVQELTNKDQGKFITLSANTDGAVSYECTTKMPLYPIFVVINELPPWIRFTKENLIVAALWLSRAGEPSMPLLFHEFCMELQELSEGMMIDGEIYKIHLIQCCSDSVCRCKLQNSKQFNGYFGCSFCLHPGECIQGQVRYPYSNDVELRSNETTKEHMLEAHRQRKELFGIKGLSVFLTIPNFNVVFGFPPDHMHAALLGVTRHIWNLIMASDVGTHKKAIEERYLSIRFPSSFSRQPRRFEEDAKFKASEWEHIALYCFYPCFYGYLSENRLKHFMYFSSSLFMLLEYKISNENLNKCDIWLKTFCAEFGSLYGQINETFNVHLITHMVETVRKLGALWNYSLFPYENGNGILLKYRTGQNKPVLQIAKKYALKKSCHSIPIPPNSPVKQYIEEIWKRKTISKLQFSEHLRYSIENEQFEEGVTSREFSYHSKVSFYGTQYCTQKYCEEFRYDDSYIKINEKFFRIVSILTDRENNIFIVGKVLKTKLIFPNLYIYKDTIQKLVIKLNESIRQCISIRVEVDEESLNCISVCKFSPYLE